jgi:hypothetical protein
MLEEQVQIVASEGEVHVGPESRTLGMVFQDLALWTASSGLSEHRICGLCAGIWNERWFCGEFGFLGWASAIARQP